MFRYELQTLLGQVYKIHVACKYAQELVQVPSLFHDVQILNHFEREWRVDREEVSFSWQSCYLKDPL